MPRELTQLEQEVASHPAVVYFRERGLPDIVRDIFAGAVDARSPRQAARTWEEESAKIMGVVTLLAKIKRDGQTAQDRQLLEDLPAVLNGHPRFRWEEEEFRAQILTDRQKKGDLKVYVLMPSDVVEGRKVDRGLQQYVDEVIAPRSHQLFRRVTSLVTSDSISRHAGGQYAQLVIDPPGGIGDIMRRIGARLAGRSPVLMRVPRNDLTMQVLEGMGPMEYEDLPLVRCLLVWLGNVNSHADRRAMVRRLRAAGVRTWTPRSHLRAVIIRDKWGEINEIPVELHLCFTVGDPTVSIPIYKIV